MQRPSAVLPGRDAQLQQAAERNADPWHRPGLNAGYLLQFAQVTSLLASKGVLHRPHLAWRGQLGEELFSTGQDGLICADLIGGSNAELTATSTPSSLVCGLIRV